MSGYVFLEIICREVYADLLLTRFLLRVLCGSRVRVEMSTGLSRKGRGRPSRRQFDPNDRCYQCGDRGHYAYDCYRFSKRGRRSR